MSRSVSSGVSRPVDLSRWADGERHSLDGAMAFTAVGPGTLVVNNGYGNAALTAAVGMVFVIDWGDGSPVSVGRGAAAHEYPAGTFHGRVRFTKFELPPVFATALVALGGDALVSLDEYGDCRGLAAPLSFESTFPPVTGAVYRSPNFTSLPAGLSPPVIEDAAQERRSFCIRLYGCDTFNQPVDHWDASTVTSLDGLFETAYVFDQPIGNWDVSSVTSMVRTFRLTQFNQDISGWDVSSVTTLESTFLDDNDFNQDISGWDVSHVENFYQTFRHCDVFNQPIGNWDVSSATNMDRMFRFCAQFQQDLSGWCVANIPALPFEFANNTSLLPENFPVWGTCP